MHMHIVNYCNLASIDDRSVGGKGCLADCGSYLESFLYEAIQPASAGHFV